MSLNSNNSLFVKTYGKPRHTQRLGNDSLWHNNMIDDFDRCLGIEDVKQTTFISPESVSSVSRHKSGKDKKNIDNLTKTTNSWSMLLHSTLNGNKVNSTIRKRNLEYSTNNNYNKNASNSKVKSTSMNKFVLPKEHSTPFYVSHSQGKQCKNSIKKKKKKLVLPEEQHYTPLKYIVTKRADTAAVQDTDQSKKSDCLNFSSSNLLEEVNDNSVLISGSFFPKLLNTELSNNKNIYLSNNEKESIKKKKKKELNLNKPRKLNSDKKNAISSSKEKNSDWYNKVMNIICENKLCFEEESKNNQDNEEIITSEDHSFKSDKICNTTETQNIIVKPLEQIGEISPILNNLSFQSNKYINENLSGKEGYSLDLKKSVNFNTISDTTNITINESKPCVLYDEDESKLYDNSIYVSFYQDDISEMIENARIPIDDNLPQINQVKTSPLNQNSICTIQNEVQPFTSINSCNLNINNSYKLSDTANNKLENSKLNNLNAHFNYNRTSLLLNGNVNISEDNSDFKSSMLSNVTNRILNISIDEKQYDQLVIEDSILEVTDQSLKFVDKSTINNSSSTLGSSSSSKQDTIINKSNNSDIYLKENIDPNTSHLNEKNVETFKFNSNSSNQSILKCNDVFDSINVINNNEIVPELTLQTSYDFAEHLLDSTILYPNTFPIISSVKNELDNSSENINQEKFQPNYNTLSNVINKSKDNFYKNSINKIQENISDDILNDKLNTSSFRKKRYAGRFQNLKLDTIEEFVDENEMDIQNLTNKQLPYTQCFHLEPGKKWRRSINIVRNLVDGNLDHTILTQNTTKGRKWMSTVDDVIKKQLIDTTIYHRLDQSNIFKNSIHYSNVSRNSIDRIGSKNEIARKLIFDICNQNELISFDSWLKPKIKKKWKKVGEGVYGEVFWYSVSKSSTVVKIIPIEGHDYINNERQKMMFEVLSEIVIATELNKLLDKNNWNSTKSFCKLKNISCVQGKYPEHLIRLWKQYNADKGSDNDNPNILPNNQMFIVMEMENGGIDVEHFLFNSANQSLYAFLQITFGLAVAEEQLSFEHRDLHIGNILVNKVASNKNVLFKLNGEIFNIPSKGVKITIIDFTLSRMTYNNKSIFNNLAEDTELFTSDGDYQFEIYRLMREETNDQWESYKPKTNIYWLHYVLDKMLKLVHYKKTTTIIHGTGLNILLNLKKSVLSFDSAKSFSQSKLVLDLLR